MGQKALWLKGQKAPWLKMSGKPQWAGKGKGWQPHGAQKGGGGQMRPILDDHMRAMWEWWQPGVAP